MCRALPIEVLIIYTCIVNVRTATVLFAAKNNPEKLKQHRFVLVFMRIQCPHFSINLGNAFFKDSPENCKQFENNTQHFLVCSQYKSNLTNITKKRQAKYLSSKLPQS